VPRFDLPFSAWVGDFAHLLLLGRWVAVALGAGTVFAVLALGRRLFSARAGWLAAGFVAVAPLPVLLSHYMAVDTPAAFFVTAALAAGAAALQPANPRRAAGAIVLSAFLTGLATGTKYNSFPALFPLLVPLWQLWREGGSARRYGIAAAAGALLAVPVAFLLSTPGALLQTPRFMRDVTYELQRNKEGQGLIFRDTPPTLLYHLGISLPIGMEWPLFLLACVGAGWSLARRRAADVYLWLFLLPFFLLLVPAQRKFVRYVTPMVPVLCLLAARAVDEGINGRRRSVWIAAAGVAGGAALASTVAHLGVLAAPDSREQAAQYLREHTRPTETVALASDAWTYTPPLDPSAGCVKVAQPYGGPPIWDAALAAGESRPEVTPLRPFKILAPRSILTPQHLEPEGALSLEKLERHRPEWVVISDYEYEDPERVKRHHSEYQDGRLDLLAALPAHYRLEKEFRPRPALPGFTWWSRGIPPHDWRYYMPTIRLYRRQ
jgi:4-amino-4-deoxy-L-arabinose transferase-like glycosyltransferase